MVDSIREQMQAAIGTRFATLLKSNQYETDMGKNVLRAHLPRLDSTVVPAVGYFINPEENTELYRLKELNEMPIRVQGVVKFGSTLPAIKAEKMYADICECALSNELTLGYDSGGTDQINAGATIIGETSGATGLIISVSLDSGTWAGGDAAGDFVLRRVVGTFQDDEDIQVGADTGMATVDGTGTWAQALTLLTGGLADAITFNTGEVIMPEADSEHVGVSITFNLKYKRIAGNPYSQT